MDCILNVSGAMKCPVCGKYIIDEEDLHKYDTCSTECVKKISRRKYYERSKKGVKMEDIKVGEIWKDIEGYENYQVSNLGRIKSKARKTKVGIKNVKEIIRKEKILTPLQITKGYLGIRIYRDLKGKTFKIHRLVAEAFIPNPQNLPQVNHIDGNKENNCVNNLEWCTCEENMKHSYKIGLRDVNRMKENMRKVGKSKKGVIARWKKSELMNM